MGALLLGSNARQEQGPLFSSMRGGGPGAGNGFRPMLRVTSVVHSESFKDAVYPHGSLNIPFIKGELVAG